TVELPEVLSDRERCARLPVLPELDLRVSGETPFKTDVSHVLVVLHLGCGVLDLVKFGGGCACSLSCDEVVTQLVHRLELGDGLRFGVLRRRVGEWLDRERCELPLSERERHGYGLVDVGGVRDAYPAHRLARPRHGRVVVDGEPPPRIVGATRPP